MDRLRGLPERWAPAAPLNCLGMADMPPVPEDDWRLGGRRAAASYRPAGSIFGKPRRAPDLNAASKCIAITNSVAWRAPLCSVSARFQIRPKISFGRPARSNICFACSPGRTPPCAPDFSNRAAYCPALSGVSGGTRKGPDPLPWGCRVLGGGPGGGGTVGLPVVPVSNLGRGPGRSASSGVGSRPAW